MTRSHRSVRRSVAWTVPLATVAVIGVAVAVPMTASAGTPSLDSITPDALLAAVQTADVPHLSGQVEETARLGLPSLPGEADSASLSWQTLITGTHTATLAVDGPERQRLALLGTLAESDVVHNGSDVWTYASGTREVTHVLLPADGARTGAEAPDPVDPMSTTPLGAAQHLLAAITPTTGVDMAANTRVAGQDAYTLVLTPKQDGSTIGRVVIAVDATRHLPLRVQVFGTGGGTAADPVFETGFTSIDYGRPSASRFDFSPPDGATVTTHDLRNRAAAPEGHDAAPSAGAPAAPTVLGTGWTSVVEVAAGPDALASLMQGTAGGRGDQSTADLLNRLLTVQANGDRLLQTALVNVLLTADGRVFAGAVQTSVLQQAAAR